MGTGERGASSELDYLMVRDGKGYPVEVKSGKSGKLRSLHQYVDSSKSSLAIRLYAGSLSVEKLKTLTGTPFTLLNIPYYLAGNLAGYIDHFATQ